MHYALTTQHASTMTASVKSEHYKLTEQLGFAELNCLHTNHVLTLCTAKNLSNTGASQLVTRLTRHNHNYNSQNLLAVIGSFGLYLSKVHSRCSTDRQRLKHVRRQLTRVDNSFPE